MTALKKPIDFIVETSTGPYSLAQVHAAINCRDALLAFKSGGNPRRIVGIRFRSPVRNQKAKGAE